jgi:acetyl esterase/lipase
MKLMGMLSLLALSALSWSPSRAPEILRLWDGDAPLAQGKQDRDVPTITIYRPSDAKATGAAIVVCPGGGYAGLAPHEAKPIGEWLAANGIVGVVLKYRLSPHYRHPAMLTDASRAMRYVRAHAENWHIDPKRIGIMGFSAGGHLASTVATHFDEGQPDSPDPIERISSRPDVAILLYPVITMTYPATHSGSLQNLLGDAPDPKLIASLSNETQVTAQTPPTFLVHSIEDAAVPAENSLLYVQACRKFGVPVELHLYEHGAHGFGLGGKDPTLNVWPRLCVGWLKKRGFLSKTPTKTAGE